MTISIFLQSVLDGLLLSLSGFGLLGRSRGKPDRLLPLLSLSSGCCRMRLRIMLKLLLRQVLKLFSS